MQITLKNVGFVSEAEVGLAGLNVIAGPNGTGKSTVGKTVYTIIKSISDCDSIVNEHREIIINSLCRAIFYGLKNDLDIAQRNSPSKNSGDMKILMDNFSYQFLNILLKHLQNGEDEQARKLINHNIKLMDSFSSLKSKSKSSVKKSLNELLSVFNAIDRNDMIKQSLEFMYEKMFRQQVNNISSHATSKIFLDNNGNNLKYHVSNNSKTLSFSDRLIIDDIGDYLEQNIIPKATFIETPLILQVASNFDLPFHWTDLIEMLSDDSVNKAKSGICAKIYKEVSSILGGELVYIDDKQDFYFVPKGTDNKLHVNNMASGEKIFGILQKMAKLGFLSPAHLLILDEPENHLHPEWQIKLAEILITLVDNNVPVLLTTHSATFIDALQEFAEAKDITDKTRFYFADKKSKTIKDVKYFKTDKDIIFESFYNAKRFLP